MKLTLDTQIRGSIPLYWYQRPDLRYKPPITLDHSVDPQEHQNACLKHIEAMAGIYGRQVMVDLVDQVGSEGISVCSVTCTLPHQEFTCRETGESFQGHRSLTGTSFSQIRAV